VRVIKPKRIREFAVQHPDAANQLEAWLRVAEDAYWTDLQHVRETYPHADCATVASGQTVTIFNVRGNKYRLIVSIKYQWGMVYVLRFLTHAEYDKNQWKDQL
jgi:mRNA interferase HigB